MSTAPTTVLALVLALAACASAGSGTGRDPGEAVPAGEEEPALRPGEAGAGAEDERDRPGARPAAPPPLPEIPAVRGALEIRVRYPESNGRVEPDSNFIFGSVGTGEARLEIDGRSVPVEPNGAFLAWLAVPEPERGDTAGYRLVARAGGEVRELLHPVIRPPRAPPAEAPRPWVDPSGLGLRAERWVRPGERATLELVAERGARLELVAGELRVPLLPVGPERGTLDRYAASVRPAQLREAACRAGRCRRAAGAPARTGGTHGLTVDTATFELVARLDDRVRRLDLAMPVAVIEPEAEPAARLREAEDPVNGRSGVVVARPTPFGPYRWRLPEGAVATVTGRAADRLRLRLADGLEAWVLLEDVVWADPVRGPAVTRDARFAPAADGDAVSFRIGLSRAVPAEAVRTGERSVALILYDVEGGLDRIAHGAGTGVESASWSQLPGPRVRIEIELAWPLWGHRLELESGEASAYEGPREGGPFEAGGEGAILRLDLRRPPAVDPAAPLRGRTIAIDPGHPDGGAYGPTGLYEGDANLAVARRLADLLRDAGARPALVRDDEGAVGLYERTRRARAVGAEIFVSIHANALPDGIPPLARAGTGTYYHHPGSAALAEAVQRGMVREMGLPDLGILWGDLAVVREPWMPAVLAEGVFLMVPRHEAALRLPEFQDRYARGILRGLEAFLASLPESLPEPGFF